MLKRSLTLVMIAMLWLQPASVAATAYSLLTYTTQMTPPGHSKISVCVQSGIVDVARNYTQGVSKNFVLNSCSGASHTLPSGWIDVALSGYRSGAWCGDTIDYYSTVNTSAWQVWVYICSNPSGTQSFHTGGWTWIWNGSGYTGCGCQVLSPNQNY
jgi:hypothetical protein